MKARWRWLAAAETTSECTRLYSAAEACRPIVTCPPYPAPPHPVRHLPTGRPTDQSACSGLASARLGSARLGSERHGSARLGSAGSRGSQRLYGHALAAVQGRRRLPPVHVVHAPLWPCHAVLYTQIGSHDTVQTEDRTDRRQNWRFQTVERGWSEIRHQGNE